METYSLPALKATSLKSRCWCQQGRAPSEAPGQSSPGLFSNLPVVAAFLGIPRLMDTWLQSLPPSLHGLLPVCLSEMPSASLTRYMWLHRELTWTTRDEYFLSPSST